MKKLTTKQNPKLELAKATLKNLKVKTAVQAGASGTYCVSCGTGTRCPE